MKVREARQILMRAVEQGLFGKSRVNPAFTKQQTYDILSYVLDEDDERSVERFTARNIRREWPDLAVQESDQ